MHMYPKFIGVEILFGTGYEVSAPMSPLLRETFLACEVSSPPCQQQDSMYSLGDTTHGPQVFDRDELKVDEAEQGTWFVLEHLKDIFDMECVWVGAKTESLHHLLARR